MKLGNKNWSRIYDLKDFEVLSNSLCMLGDVGVTPEIEERLAECFGRKVKVTITILN